MPIRCQLLVLVIPKAARSGSSTVFTSAPNAATSIGPGTFEMPQRFASADAVISSSVKYMPSFIASPADAKEKPRTGRGSESSFVYVLVSAPAIKSLVVAPTRLVRSILTRGDVLRLEHRVPARNIASVRIRFGCLGTVRVRPLRSITLASATRLLVWAARRIALRGDQTRVLPNERDRVRGRFGKRALTTEAKWVLTR